MKVYVYVNFCIDSEILELVKAASNFTQVSKAVGTFGIKRTKQSVFNIPIVY